MNPAPVTKYGCQAYIFCGTKIIHGLLKVIASRQVLGEKVSKAL